MIQLVGPLFSPALLVDVSLGLTLPPHVASGGLVSALHGSCATIGKFIPLTMLNISAVIVGDRG